MQVSEANFKEAYFKAGENVFFHFKATTPKDDSGMEYGTKFSDDGDSVIWLQFDSNNCEDNGLEKNYDCEVSSADDTGTGSVTVNFVGKVNTHGYYK